MKNKHLVMLFLVVLAIGLVAKYAPSYGPNFFQTELVEIDTALVTELSITLPGQPELLLERTDEGWAATQFNRAVAAPASGLASMLAALVEIRSRRIVKTRRPDTLGLAPSEALHLSILLRDGRKESFKIGKETSEDGQPVTYLELPGHDGIYLVHRHLRLVFSKTIDDFRENTVARFDPASISGFSIFWEKTDTVIFQKNDSTRLWDMPGYRTTMPDDSIQTWLHLFSRLNGLPYADLFDESHAEDILVAHITLYLAAQPEPLVLKIFHLAPPNVPEELPEPSPDLRQFSPYVFHSSQNPANYFAFSDTTLLKQICFSIPQKPNPDHEN